MTGECLGDTGGGAGEWAWEVKTAQLGSHEVGWKPCLPPAMAPLSSRMSQPVTRSLGSRGGSGGGSKLVQMENDEILLES